MAFLLVLFPGPDFPLSVRFMPDLFIVVTDLCMLQGQMTYTCPRGTVYGHHTFLYKCGAQLTLKQTQ